MGFYLACIAIGSKMKHTSGGDKYFIARYLNHTVFDKFLGFAAYFPRAYMCDGGKSRIRMWQAIGERCKQRIERESFEYLFAVYYG